MDVNYDSDETSYSFPKQQSQLNEHAPQKADEVLAKIYENVVLNKKNGQYLVKTKVDLYLSTLDQLDLSGPEQILFARYLKTSLQKILERCKQFDTYISGFSMQSEDIPNCSMDISEDYRLFQQVPTSANYENLFQSSSSMEIPLNMLSNDNFVSMTSVSQPNTISTKNSNLSLSQSHCKELLDKTLSKIIKTQNFKKPDGQDNAKGGPQESKKEPIGNKIINSDNFNKVGVDTKYDFPATTLNVPEPSGQYVSQLAKYYANCDGASLLNEEIDCDDFVFKFPECPDMPKRNDPLQHTKENSVENNAKIAEPEIAAVEVPLVEGGKRKGAEKSPQLCRSKRVKSQLEQDCILISDNQSDDLTINGDKTWEELCVDMANGRKRCEELEEKITKRLLELRFEKWNKAEKEDEPVVNMETHAGKKSDKNGSNESLEKIAIEIQGLLKITNQQNFKEVKEDVLTDWSALVSAIVE